MSSNEKISPQRVQLARHTFSYFFPYYWISLTVLLLLYKYLNTRHGMQFQSPWNDSSGYTDYTSKQAAMTAAWVAIAGISVREQKATSIISSCLSRKLPSFCIALILTFNSSILVVANYAWLTKGDAAIFSKLTSGATGVGFSLAALISPYLFILLAQGNPDIKTLENRKKYLNQEQIHLQNLVNAATEFEKQKQEYSKCLRWIIYVPPVAIAIYCVIGLIVGFISHKYPPLMAPPFIFTAALIELTSIPFFTVFLLTSWVWKQLWVQKTVDFNGEKLHQILLRGTRKIPVVKKAIFRRSSHKEEGAPSRDRNQETSEATRDSTSPENEKQPSKNGLLYYISAAFTLLVLFTLFSSAAYILFIIGRSVFWYIIPEIPYIKNIVGGKTAIKLPIVLTCGVISLISTTAAIDLYARVRRQPTPIHFKQWVKISISQVASKGLATNSRDKAMLDKLNSPTPPGKEDQFNSSNTPSQNDSASTEDTNKSSDHDCPCTGHRPEGNGKRNEKGEDD